MGHPPGYRAPLGAGIAHPPPSRQSCMPDSPRREVVAPQPEPGYGTTRPARAYPRPGLPGSAGPTPRCSGRSGCAPSFARLSNRRYASMALSHSASRMEVGIANATPASRRAGAIQRRKCSSCSASSEGPLSIRRTNASSWTRKRALHASISACASRGTSTPQVRSPVGRTSTSTIRPPARVTHSQYWAKASSYAALAEARASTRQLDSSYCAWTAGPFPEPQYFVLKWPATCQFP